MSVLEPTRSRPPVPKEYSGRWIAWNSSATRIIASGDDLASVVKKAQEAGEAQPSFEKIPRTDMRIIGAAR